MHSLDSVFHFGIEQVFLMPSTLVKELWNKLHIPTVYTTVHIMA